MILIYHYTYLKFVARTHFLYLLQLETLEAKLIVIFRLASIKLNSFIRTAFVEFKNCLDLENTSTIETRHPVFVYIVSE